MGDITILCSGDLHLGRISSHCTREDEPLGDYAVRDAWQRLVDLAIARHVQLLLLSGDVADDAGNLYETMGPFEAGIARLAEHGIQVYLVAGNHDARVLPRLLSMCAGETVHLLGRDGWEHVAWPNAAAPELTLAGWSYPGGRIPALPLDQLILPASAATPVIVMAHADYRTNGQDYAATNLTALRSVRGVDLWLLGHIHAPEYLNERSPSILNPGSPQALDPGEPGLHGPWLLDISAGCLIRVEQVPLSSVVYSTFAADVSAMREDEELLSYLRPALEEQKRLYRWPDYTPRLSCRITLRGRTNALNKLCEDRGKLLQEQPLLEAHDILIDQIELSQLAPAYDLAVLRERADVIGTLAGILCELEFAEPGPLSRPLLLGAEAQARLLANAPAFREGVALDELPAMAAVLQTECRRLLHALLQQEEARV